MATLILFLFAVCAAYLSLRFLHDGRYVRGLIAAGCAFAAIWWGIYLDAQLLRELVMRISMKL